MKILSISAQKPDSTGSGVFLTELVRALERRGCVQAVVAGVYPSDRLRAGEDVTFYPVYFEEHPENPGEIPAQVPFPIVGMSDEMPYRSTRYRDLTPEMTAQFQEAFLRVIRQAVDAFDPDVILCHHLYLLTAIVREAFPDRRICGFCHNTDLRQLEKQPLMRDVIKKQIPGLDRIFALHKEQRARISRMFDIPEDRIEIVGMGYNSKIFRKLLEHRPAKGEGLRLIYAGKIAEKKGVMSLMRALLQLPFAADELEVFLAGGAGNEREYQDIRAQAKESPYPVHFLGKLDQKELAVYYNRSQVFVLPSFYEGLPLTVIEALACGCRVVMTDLPGIREWIEENAPGADVCYVTPPRIVHTDEAEPESLPAFEQRLAGALAQSLSVTETAQADTSGISWDGIAGKVLADARSV